ncbi:MAG: 16S rRNA (adenine(1518)-N(6)/adenine(1519)-N(6))-dimethyltransferase RsmA [Methanocellales archaeon]|nr:16S rRNA (adenine(1518)-N(6)/adenine(1519)-N(6))-dimethyltransferase RsmA [Methanocellales archaeon]
MKTRINQHFLIDSRVIERIINYANIHKTETILEIGAGFGNLTKKLAAEAANVIAVESDPHLVEALGDLELPNVTIVHGDALKVDFPKFDKVVSNLPYSISSEVTFKLFKHSFELGILMYQYEFAQRMIATPGTKDYGRLSIGIQYFADVKVLEIVPRTAFRPPPEVRSAIVKIVPRPPFLDVVDKDFFFDFVAAVFTQRRKQMKNAIINAAHMLGVKDVKKAVNLLPKDLMHKRPEQLSPEELANLSNLIYEARYDWVWKQENLGPARSL